MNRPRAKSTKVVERQKREEENASHLKSGILAYDMNVQRAEEVFQEELVKLRADLMNQVATTLPESSKTAVSQAMGITRQTLDRWMAQHEEYGGRERRLRATIDKSLAEGGKYGEELAHALNDQWTKEYEEEQGKP